MKSGTTRRKDDAMRKMIFIEPKSPNLHIFSKFQIPRLGSFILGTMMKNRGWDVEIQVEELHALSFEDIRKADLVGISTITPTAPRAYAIADRVRSMGIPVIMGGPHVSFLPDEAMEHSDYVVRGEGERPLMSLVDSLESGSSFAGIPNLSFRENGCVVHNPMDGSFQDLDRIPHADFSLLHQGALPSVAGRRIIPVQTSRGCPYNCSFCSVTGMFGRRYRFRSTDHILEELRRYNDPRNFVFFYDDHFTADRRRTQALLTAMIDEKMRFQWSTQVRVEIGNDPDLVGLMKKAGCHTLFIGLESVNPDSLEEMGKRQTVQNIEQAIRVLQKNRIHIHGMFVYGFDQDDWKTVRQTVRFAKKARLTSTQFLILTPLPGSEFYRKVAAENRIRFQDWSLYDAHHPVFEPRRFTLAALQKAQIFSHGSFYSISEMFKKLASGRWVDLGLAHYARRLNRFWKRKNRTFLKALDLLSHQNGARILLDYQTNIELDP
jgi:radical SAM superfamily enzyme YgiQ (UPF0313 family)